MSNPRAVRYRRLALQEPDKENAQLLRLIADEADRGILCGHTDDRDHLFRSIATSVARALTAPLDGGGDVSLLMAGQAR